MFRGGNYYSSQEHYHYNRKNDETYNSEYNSVETIDLIETPVVIDYNDDTLIYNLNFKKCGGGYFANKYGVGFTTFNGEIPKLGTRIKNEEDFIIESMFLHGSIYDYSKVEYIGNYKKVKLLCKFHGEFEQIVEGNVNYISPSRCPKCSRENRAVDIKFGSFQDFTQERRESDILKTYDFSKMVFVNMITEIIVGCPTHGDFKIKPYDLYNGLYCPKCKSDQQKTDIKLYNIKKEHEELKNIARLKYDIFEQIFVGEPYLYLIAFLNDNCFKVGISSNDFTRLFKHNKTYGIDFKNSYIITANSKSTIRLLEREIKHTFEKFQSYDYYGKDGHTEIRDIKDLEDSLYILDSKLPILNVNRQSLEILDLKEHF